MFNYQSVVMLLSLTHRICYPVACLAFLLLLPVSSRAADASASKKFLSQLIWCTDKAKPADQDLKELNTKLVGKVRRIFKWQNYFEVSRQLLTLPDDEGKRFRVSKRCEVVVKELEGEQIEVFLYGDKKLTNKAVHKYGPILTKGEHLMIGGDDKDNYGDAWLLVISAAPKK